MKERSNWAVLGIIFCQLFWPCMKLVSHFTFLEFYFHSELIYLLLNCTLTMWLYLFLLRQESPASQWLCMILFPVTILCGTMEVLFFHSIFTVPLTALNCICAGSLFSRSIPDRWYKYLLTLICTLLIIAYVYLCGLCLIFGQIGSQGIVQEVTSPDGQKTAQLIDDNQGALGGNTFVYVRYRDILSLVFGGLRPDSQLIYRGRWGEFEGMSLSWQDDNTLLINDTTFSLP